MSETGAETALTKRIVFIGDQKVGKTTLINAFQESNPSCCLPSEKKDEVSKSDEINKATPLPSQKQASKDSEEESDEDSSVVDPALAAEIEAMVLHATMRHEGCVYQIGMLEASSDIAVMKKQRSAVYAHADVVVVMYSIESVKSFRNASKKWRSHVKKFLKNETCPIFLVANKLDLRGPEAQDEDSEEDDEDKQSVSTQAGKKLAKKLGAVEYFECSALNKEGIFEMFAKAATHVYKGKPVKCTIL